VRIKRHKIDLVLVNISAGDLLNLKHAGLNRRWLSAVLAFSSQILEFWTPPVGAIVAVCLQPFGACLAK
jgi:hypothetical protein